MTAQLLIGGQVCSAINLLLTVVFLRLFHHQPPAPVPKRLRYFVFRIVAPVTLYNRNTNVTQNEDKVQPTDVEPNYDVSTECENRNQVHSADAMPKKSEEIPSIMEEFDTERNGGEWQVMSRILDRFLFMLNVVAMSIALSYAYITLYIH